MTSIALNLLWSMHYLFLCFRCCGISKMCCTALVIIVLVYCIVGGVRVSAFHQRRLFFLQISVK